MFKRWIRFQDRKSVIITAVTFLLLFLFAIALVDVPKAFSSPADVNSDSALLDGYRHVEVASVSDAMEKITGQKAYLSHRMHPVFPAKFAGYAVTVSLRKEENKDPHALDGMLAAIDQGGPNSVYVMVVEDGADIAGMGGLMGTAMQARDFAGAGNDGGVRDTAYLTKIGFPVYALGNVPSTSVGHYRFAGANIKVICDGVPVNAGDIVVADNDGVVVVPRDKAAEVLATAQEMDLRNTRCTPILKNSSPLRKP